MNFGSPEELKRFLNEVLKEPRRAILKAISLKPGISSEELRKYVSSTYRRISRNALYYHLEILERHGLIYHKGAKPKRRFLAEKRLCLIIGAND